MHVLQTFVGVAVVVECSLSLQNRVEVFLDSLSGHDVKDEFGHCDRD